MNWNADTQFLEGLEPLVVSRDMLGSADLKVYLVEKQHLSETPKEPDICVKNEGAKHQAIRFVRAPRSCLRNTACSGKKLPLNESPITLTSNHCKLFIIPLSGHALPASVLLPLWFWTSASQNVFLSWITYQNVQLISVLAPSSSHLLCEAFYDFPDKHRSCCLFVSTRWLFLLLYCGT